MSAHRADADPATFRDSKITGAYILDPWYPAVSSIRGASNPPGTCTTFAELRENFLPWKRPEGETRRRRIMGDHRVHDPSWDLSVRPGPIATRVAYGTART